MSIKKEDLFVNNDTVEQVSRYIDNICSDPGFLCNNKQLCGSNTSIYTSVDNVNKICDNIIEGNKCDNEFKECVILATNYIDESEKYISTSFVNIIVPIPNEVDDLGNQKFLRLPALSSSKNPKSKDICNICACMNRFSTSPGAGDNNYTSPGQNQCIYPSSFEYYYYPISVDNINNILKDTPKIVLGKYTIINSNIIHAPSEESLNVGNLYELLIKNKITKENTVNFIKYLYKDNQEKNNELNLYFINKDNKQVSYINKGKSYENMSLFYIIFIIIIILVFYILL